MITKKWSDDKDQYVNICNAYKLNKKQAEEESQDKEILKNLSKPASNIETSFFKSKPWKVVCVLCIIIAIVWFLKGMMS